MLVKTVNYTDYNGVDVKETVYFNLNEAELMSMNMSVAGSMQNQLQKMIDSNNGPAIMKTFEEILHRSYGVKSDDGRRFIKNEEVWTAFKESPAYPKIFMELMTDPAAAGDFIAAILPPELGDEVHENLNPPEEKVIPIASSTTTEE